MISTIKFKKCVAGASILDVNVGELRHGKKSYLIILLEVDKGSKIGFYCTILPFGLTVCLWMEGDGESPLYAKEIA